MPKINKKRYEIIFIATMSAGKSTAINALIGQELFHSANEATTATITEIHDKDGLTHFEGTAYDFNDQLIEENKNCNSELLKQWNADNNIKTIKVTGDVKMVDNDDLEVVLIDSPGPNNSQDQSHSTLTNDLLKQDDYSQVIYLMNATQLGTNDDRSFLADVKEILKNKKFKNIIFLLNKADSLDEERGESLKNVVHSAEKYLQNIGFKNPTIIPTSATTALLCQKALTGKPLTRRERSELKNITIHRSTKEKNHLVQCARISGSIKNTLIHEMNRKEKDRRRTAKITINPTMSIPKLVLQNLYIRSGFGIVQQLIQQQLSHKQ